MTTWHRSMSEEQRQASGITLGLVRLSEGMEAYPDMIGELAVALSRAGV